MVRDRKGERIVGTGPRQRQQGPQLLGKWYLGKSAEMLTRDLAELQDS